MKKMIKGKTFKVLVGLVVFFVVSGVASWGNPSVRYFLTGFWLTPLQQLTTRGTQSIGEQLSPQQNLDELSAENNRLRAENRRLQDMLVDYYTIQQENEQLEKFYSIKRSHSDFSVVPASVIGRDPNEHFYGFTLDKGSDDGLHPQDPVMTENGLVGWVSAVTPKSCQVSTILSPEAAIGAEVLRTHDSGLLCGQAKAADDGLTRMVNLSSQHTLQPQDMVVTSGYGGLFPQHLKVGLVKYTALDEYTGMPLAVIEPFEDIRSVTAVAVITAFDQ